MAETDRQSRISRALGKMVTEGLAMYLSDTVGVEETDNEEEKRGKLRRFFREKRKEASGAVKEAVNVAFTDERVQRSGAEAVRESVQETVDGAREAFDDTLYDAAETLEAEASTDERTTFQKMRELLGNNPEDKWYKRIGKNIVARVGQVGLPIVNIISSRLAAKFTGNNTPEDRERYKGQFDSIYKGLLTRATRPRAERAPAAA